jgi:hypothetical protein
MTYVKMLLSRIFFIISEKNKIHYIDFLNICVKIEKENKRMEIIDGRSRIKDERRDRCPG